MQWLRRISALPMITSYLKTSLRNLSRSLSYTVINVSGLALGITCAILIFSMVSYHMQFDKFHEHSDRIYRFVTEQHRDQVSYASSVPPAFGKTFQDDYTFGEKVARVCSEDALFSFEHKGNNFKYEEEFAFADASYLEIFNFPLAEGGNELSSPGTAIVSERIAKKYFGDESAIGKTFRFANMMDFRISGVMQDLPDQTDFRSEILLSYLNIGTYSEWYAEDDAWGGITSSIQTFTRLQPGVDPTEVEEVLPAYVKKYRAENKNVHHYKLQPLSDIHFNQQYDGRISKTMLLILSVIGFFLVFTACLNFINLATAHALGRSREVGVRKALGSKRAQLFWQFTVETFMVVAISFIVSFCISYAVVPFMNDLLGSRVSIDLFDYRLLLFSSALVMVETFLAGAYPGLVLSGFKPVQALKGKPAEAQSGGINMRRILITAQFTISQVLLIGLIVVVSQMDYFRNADLGFDKDAIVMIPMGSNDEKAKTLKDKFLALPGVERVSMCLAAPSSLSNWNTTVKFDNRAENEDFAVSFKGADDDYVTTFGIELIAGRNLVPSDTVREYLVNETLVKKLGETHESILGKNLFFNGEFNGAVVGVVADFHDRTLRNVINPVFVATHLEDYNDYAVKINMANASSTLAALEKAWLATYPIRIYSQQFLDDETASFYEAEETIMKVVEVFSFIALFIGCMGLYGLVSFMAVRKTKEIGIRKVLGGTVQHILWIFGKEFMRLVLIAFLLAAPLSWVLMTEWLSNYEYKIDITAWIFVADFLVILFIVVLTVGFRSARAAMINPARALRSE